VDKIQKGYKEIPVTIAGISGVIRDMTPANYLEIQNFLLIKRAKAIDAVFANDKVERLALKKALLDEEIKLDSINKSDVSTMYYLLYVRFSGKDKVTFEQFFSDTEGIEEASALAFPKDDGGVKNDQAGKRK